MMRIAVPVPRRAGRPVAVAAAVVAIGLAAPTAVSATTTSAGVATSSAAGTTGAASPEIGGGAPLAPDDYLRFRAGFTATPPGGDLRRARARFVIPEYQCVADRHSVAVGLGSEPTFGDPRYLAYASFDCTRKDEALYGVKAYVAGRTAVTRAAAGDRVRVSTRHTDGDWVWVKAYNVTTGKGVRLGGVPYAHETENDVDFGAFPLFFGRVADAPNFGRLPIRNARVIGADSEPVCIESTDPERRTRADRETGELEIGTSRLHGCNFSLRWHSY